MDEKQIAVLTKKIKAERIYTSEGFKSFFKTHEIKNKEDKLKILCSVVKNEHVGPLLIGDLIVDCTIKNQLFVNLIIQISKNDRLVVSCYDLVNLYKKSHEIAEYVYEKLKARNDEQLAITMGYILQGVGRTEPEELFKIILRKKNPIIIERIAFLISLQLPTTVLIPQKLVNFVISNSNSSNEKIKRISIRTLVLSLCKLAKVQKQLKKLAQKDDNVASIISYDIVAISKIEPQSAFKILKMLSNTTN